MREKSYQFQIRALDSLKIYYILVPLTSMIFGSKKTLTSCNFNSSLINLTDWNFYNSLTAIIRLIKYFLLKNFIKAHLKNILLIKRILISLLTFRSTLLRLLFLRGRIRNYYPLEDNYFFSCI